MSISKTYLPAEIESRWYAFWLDKKMFSSVSTPDTSGNRKEPYTVVIPPPNVTGVLHMGHMLNNTIQDVLVRRARMLGKNACWVPGTDHASIATEAKVVALLKEEGKTKEETGREEFLKKAFEWKEKYGGIILQQLMRLGASCDWDRTRFTMEESLSEAVLQTFIDLYKKGLIYRGLRMVNWDPAGRTAVSDEEVIHKSVNQRLYYIRYVFSEGSGELIVATARPETIMADAAIAVNPADPRYQALIGKTVRIPLIGREIPILADDYVSIDFGTGCLKVTPAHSLQDYEIGLRHNLPVIDILSEDGTLNEKAGIYIGEDRFAARKKIARELEEKGLLQKTEDYVSQVGYSERTDAVIEPRISRQWFLKMQELSQPALTAVESGKIKLFPARFTNTYRHWLENVHDWCISRQLWWGQQIPAWYNDSGDTVVALSRQQAVAEFSRAGQSVEGIWQDEDVLDTWFSSWLWPISVFDGITKPGNPDISYYYPTSDLVTGPDILFFWVARMIMAGEEIMHEVPFRNVYLTGIIRDKLGRKMSKSLGNSPDPIELIEKFGADAVRTGLLLSSPAGNDLLYDESLIEQGRNFANKIWNAFRLVHGWDDRAFEEEGAGSMPSVQPVHNRLAIHSFEQSFNLALAEIEEHFIQFRLSDALMSVYKLIWDDFCSWYLELIKPETGKRIDSHTYRRTIELFESVLGILHPFMPFISEELWHEIAGRNENDSLMLSAWPKSIVLEHEAAGDHRFSEKVLKPLTQQIRNTRNTQGISARQTLILGASAAGSEISAAQKAAIARAANVSEIEVQSSKPADSIILLAGGIEFYLTTGLKPDKSAEIKKLEEELNYTLGFLRTVESKLSNERFVAGAKAEIVEVEKQKKNDALAKIASLRENILELSAEE